MHPRPLVLALSLAAVAAIGVACAPRPAREARPITVQRTEQVSNTRSLLIAVSPVNERVVWASGARGTWVRTVDGGTTWTSGTVPGADSLQFRDVHAFSADHALLMSIGNGSDSRIYRTRDAGATWERVHTNPDSAGFYDCFSFWDAKRGILVGDAVDGKMVVLTTEDGGGTWTRVPWSILPPAQKGEGSFAASGTCITTQGKGNAWIVMNAGTVSRLVHTRDHGRTWDLETLPVTARDGSGAQSITFRDGTHGMVIAGGYASQPADAHIAVTEDGGASWTLRARPTFKVGSWGGVYVPGTRTVVVAGPNGSAYSRDEGASWVPIDTLNYWSVGFASPRAGWAVGTQGRITKLAGF